MAATDRRQARRHPTWCRSDFIEVLVENLVMREKR